MQHMLRDWGYENGDELYGGGEDEDKEQHDHLEGDPSAVNGAWGGPVGVS